MPAPSDRPFHRSKPVQRSEAGTRQREVKAHHARWAEGSSALQMSTLEHSSASPEYILAVLQDLYRHAPALHSDAEPGWFLTFETTVAHESSAHSPHRLARQKVSRCCRVF